MIVRAALLLLFFLSLSLSLAAADWALEIIPNGSNAAGQSIDTRSQAFVVLLTNTSDHDLNTWIEEFSWGYDNLSFLVTRADGSSFRVVKQQELFTMNVAIPYLVRSHGHFAWAVTFSPDEWTGFPANWKGTEDVTIQARFEIDPTPQSKEMKVWTGKVESLPMKVTLTRFLKQWYMRKTYSDSGG
jgi:hypothetical protein